MSEKGEIFYKTEKQKCVLRKIMKCGQCGSTYIRKKSRDKYYWSCRKHDLKASECFSKRIPESDIYYAFIRICNKLISNYTQILIPLQTALQYLKLKNSAVKLRLWISTKKSPSFENKLTSSQD